MNDTWARYEVIFRKKFPESQAPGLLCYGAQCVTKKSASTVCHSYLTDNQSIKATQSECQDMNAYSKGL
jgi:hypothetical protein